jgi:four helix bundle protein
MTPDDLKRRTRTFAVDLIQFAKRLPADAVTAVIARQLVRSGTSVGANYRSSCRAKSDRDFISKLTTAEEEADESQYWLEILVQAKIVRPDAVAGLIDEADQLVRIFVASIRTTRRRMETRRCRSTVRNNPQNNPRSEFRNPKC